MTEKSLLAAGALLCLLLAACAPMGQQPPAPPEPEPPAPIEDKTEEEEKPPVKPEEPPPTSSAVSSLVNRGWSAYRGSDYDTALTYAERAQRIDPRSPEVYLLMARAQLSLYRRDLAEQVARRGLAMARSGTAVYSQLQSLLTEISGTP